MRNREYKTFASPKPAHSSPRNTWYRIISYSFPPPFFAIPLACAPGAALYPSHSGSGCSLALCVVYWEICWHPPSWNLTYIYKVHHAQASCLSSLSWHHVINVIFQLQRSSVSQWEQTELGSFHISELWALPSDLTRVDSFLFSK